MPDVITYSALISACEKAQDPQRASQVLNGIQQQGLIPNIITYNALLSRSPVGAPVVPRIFLVTVSGRSS